MITEVLAQALADSFRDLHIEIAATDVQMERPAAREHGDEAEHGGRASPVGNFKADRHLSHSVATAGQLILGQFFKKAGFEVGSASRSIGTKWTSCPWERMKVFKAINVSLWG